MAPPGLGARSTMATRLPKYAACAAPFSPAGPVPITTMSKFSTTITQSARRTDPAGNGSLSVLIVSRTVRGMRIVELWRYPVKSLLGERLDHASVTSEGLEG